MDFAVSEEHERFAESVRRYLSERIPMAETRRLLTTPEGYERRAWKELADILGVPGVAVPEAYGGSGFGYEELAIVFEEAGRGVVGLPLLSTAALATPALLESQDEEARARYLPGIASGELVATLALAEGFGALADESQRVRAERTGDRTHLYGDQRFVLDGITADLLLVPAAEPEGLTLFAVDLPDNSVTVTPLETLDLTRRQANLRLDGTPARQVGPAGTARGFLRRTLDVAATLLTAEQVGGAQRVLEMSTEYAKVRYQFGRPIGSFQAIKHTCADMLVQVETARSASLFARKAAAAEPVDLPVAASLAKAYCSDAYLFCAAKNIQVHGGIGFTWDHDAHLYFRRAKSTSLLLGMPAAHRAELARLTGMTSPAGAG